MYPESIPIDYTGYGPTGTGYRPSQGQIRRQQENKYRTNRNAEMMSYVDPSVNAAVGVASRAFMGADNDPTKVRDYMNNSAQGQMIRDGAMMMRRNGMLGAGDPINYSHNITRGITGGGFTTDIIGKDQNGRSALGLDQRVQGNGLLAERVTQRFQKGLLDNLYGKDQLADPSKLSGFDMEEASGVAATIMRRGGVGKAATLVHGADAQTRIDAARDAATPEMREKLAGIKVGSNKELDELAASTKDPKLQKELSRVAKETITVVTNDGAAKKVAGVVKEVTKGMAALNDMYGELEAPQLHQMLESISGKQIVNKQQAKHASNMVNDMRNSAESLGMDPRAYFDYIQQAQLNFQQKYMQNGGFDSRSETTAKGSSAAINAQIQREAASSAVLSQQATAQGEARGYNMTGTTKTAFEIAADAEQQTLINQASSVGESLIRGGIDRIKNPETRTAAEKLLAAKGATTDETKRRIIEDQLRALAGREFGGPSQTVEAAAASNAGVAMITSAHKDPEQIRSAKAASLAAINTSVMDQVGTGKLGLSATDSTAFSQRILTKLGKKGFADLTDIAMQPDQIGDQKVTAKDRNDQITNLLRSSGMSEDEITDTRGKLFDNSTGRFKDNSLAKDYSETVGLVSYGGEATYEELKGAENRLAQEGQNGKRNKIGETEGKVTTSGIVNAMLKKAIGDPGDDETLALSLQALKAEGMTELMVDAKDAEGKTILENGNVKRVNALDGVDSNIDMSNNIEADDIARLTKVNGGKDLGILKKFGYKDEAEMAEKTKDAREREKVLNYMKNETDLNLTGPWKATTAVSDVALDAARNDENGPEAIMRKRAGAKRLGGGLDVKFTADEKLGRAQVRSKGPQTVELEGNRKFVTAAQSINNADDEGMKDILAYNKDGNFEASMKTQLATLKQAKAAELDTVISRDPSTGKNDATDSIDKSIKDLESALARIAGATTKENGGQVVNEMRVTHLHIDNVADLKKS